MSMIRLEESVDDKGLLSAIVPPSVPPGPVTVLVLPASEEESKAELWTAGVAQEWADELSDTRQDIYTLADGEPVGEF